MKPNDLGKITADVCQSVRVSEYLKIFRNKLKEVILSSSAEILGTKISVVVSKTGFGGLRHWFKCPCGRRTSALFVHPVTHKVGCRICLGIKYRKQRYKGMPENI